MDVRKLSRRKREGIGAAVVLAGMDEFGFLTGVLLQRVTRLGDVFGDSEIRRSVQFEALSQDFRRFAELSAVAVCDYTL